MLYAIEYIWLVTIGLLTICYVDYFYFWTARDRTLQSVVGIYRNNNLFCLISDYRVSNSGVEYLRETALDTACVYDVISVDYVN